MSKESRITELVKNYKDAENKLKKYYGNHPIACLNRDIIRNTRKIFEKEMHEPIDKYLNE